MFNLNIEKLRPAKWIRRAVAVNHKPFVVNSSLRAAACIGLPFFVGIATDMAQSFMWFAMAGILWTAGEKQGELFQRGLKKVLFVTPFGAAAIVLGYLELVGTWLQILVLFVAATISGMIATWNTYMAATTVQVLLLGSMVTGMSGLVWWEAAAFYVAGTLFYLLLFGTVGLLAAKRTEHAQLLPVLRTLADTCTTRATRLESGDLDVGGNLVQPTGSEDHEYSAFVRSFSAAMVPEMLRPRYLALLEAIDQVAARAWVSTQPEDLRWAADQLQLVVKNLDTPEVQEPPVPAGISPTMVAAVSGLWEALREYRESPEHSDRTDLYPSVSAVVAVRGERWSRTSITNGARVGVAYGVALLCGLLFPFKHIYWTASTVAMEMTPNPSAVVSRAVQRSIGTVVGVAIGAAALLISNNRFWLASVITVAALLLPWCAANSQVFKQFAMTPAVLLLSIVIAPDTQGPAYYGWERILTTLLGSAIVFVFGHLLWSSARRPDFADHYPPVQDSLVAYLRGTMDQMQSPRQIIGATAKLRATCFRRLVQFRQPILTAAAEPPPASKIANEWFPTYLASARVCDQITQVAELAQVGEKVSVSMLRHCLTALEDLGEHPSDLDAKLPELSGLEPGSPKQNAAQLVDSIRVLNERLEKSVAISERQRFTERHPRFGRLLSRKKEAPAPA